MGAVAPKGSRKMPSPLRFGAIFPCTPISRLSISFPFPPHFFPYLSPLQFYSALPQGGEQET